MAHICAITPVSLMVGANRIVTAHQIVNPLGNANMNAQEEKRLRRSIVEKALKALQTDVREPTVLA